MSFASAEQANSDSLMVAQALPAESQPAPTTPVSQPLRRAETELDEGCDYFSAQGAIDRWKVQRA